MALVEFKNNDQIIKERDDEARKTAGLMDGARSEAQGLNMTSIVKSLRNKWDRARRAKIQKIEPQMFKNLRQTMSEYEPKKLNAIRELGSDVFMGITDTKVRNFISWVMDILSQKIWAVEPTPVSELPPSLQESVQLAFVQSAMQKAMASMPQDESMMDMSPVISAIQTQIPAMEDDIARAVKDKAQAKARVMEKEIDDKLVEGGWYEALYSTVFDLAVLNNAFLKGPLPRRRPVMKAVKNDQGQDEMQVQDEVVKEFERRSPFDIYPEPDSNGINDGYLFDHVSYRRKDLIALIGVEGFNEHEQEIRAVLNEFKAGGLREWTGIETERAELEKRDPISVHDSDKIEGLEYYGPVSAAELKEWGVADELDMDLDYESVVYMIGNHIIFAMVNRDPFGNKPFYTAGFDEHPDTFWHTAIPEKIIGPQNVCNACARGLVNNVAMGSGPQVEINTDRLIGGLKGDTRLIPWKRWLTTNRQMQTGQAINFWQPQMHAQELLTVYRDFSKVADEHSNIPAYAHADSQVGGAGNTASGLSMLITQASRGIKGVIRNIDRHLIAPSVQTTYNEIAMDPKHFNAIGDVRLVAKGSAVLIEKEQRAIRMLEFLTATNNPLDAQLTGLQGRGYLLQEVARSHDIDAEKAVPNVPKTEPVPSMPQANPGVTPPAPGGGGGPTMMEQSGTAPAPANMDMAGNAPQGADHQLFTGRGGSPAAPPAIGGAT